MNKISYRRHRFPAEIIQRAVWLCFRFPLSYRDVEDLLAERGVDVSYETIRRWSLKFGQAYVLIDGIRRVALKNTALANAVPSTIRLKLLKIGARVVNSVRRIKLSLPDACPGKTLFFKAHAALAPP